MDKARLKKLFDEYNAINSVIRAHRYVEALREVNTLLDSLSDFQREYFPTKRTPENKENNNQNNRDDLLPSPGCDSKLALVVVGSLLNKLSCLTDTATIADVKDVVQTMLLADAWIHHLTAAQQPVTQYVDNLTRAVCATCAKIDSKIQGSEAGALEKLIQLRSASLKVLERVAKTAPEMYFDHLHRTIVIMQKFNNAKAVEFVKSYLSSNKQIALSYESHIDSYLTCLYTVGRCLERENKFTDADEEYQYIWGYLDTLQKKKRIDNIVYDIHNVCVRSHKCLLCLVELTTTTKSNDERVVLMNSILKDSSKFIQAVQELLPKINIDQKDKSATKRATSIYDTLCRINTILREVRRVVSSDICSVGSATGAKVPLPEKVLKGLEELMVVHSEIIKKGLELDTQLNTKGSLKFKLCEQYEWEALSSAALLAFEGNKNESKFACAHLEKAAEIIRAKNRPSELKSISSLYYNIGILFYNKKNYSGAAEPLLKCCEIYEEWGQTNAIDEKTLAKRKELVSICRQKSNDVDGALKEIVDGILKTISSAKGEVAPLVKRFCAIKLQTVASATNKRDFAGFTLMKVLEKAKVTPKQKGQVLEAEYELYFKYDKEDWALEVLSGLLQVYKAKEHPVRRARMLLERAQFDRKNQDAASALKNIEEAVELLKGDVSEDKDLQEELVNDLAIAYAWLAIARRDNDEEVAYSELDGILSLALQMWTTVVNNLKPEVAEDNKRFFGSLEKTEAIMRLLVDLFGLLDDKKKVVHTYKLLIRFYRCVYTTKEAEYERILFYASIGSVYHSMGHTRSAARYISKSKTLLDNEQDLPDKYKVNWILLTVNYLHEIGQISTTEELEKIEQSQHAIIYEQKKRTRTHYLALAQTMSTLANMLSEKGDISGASAKAQEALRYRSQTLPKQNLDILKRVEAEANKKDDDPNNEVRREDEDIATTSVDEGEASSAESFFNESMTFNKWGILKAFAESLLQTAALFELQGNVYYAQYYYLKGMCLAKILNAPRLRASFLLRLAKVSLKQERWEEWNNHIKEFEETQNKHLEALDDVNIDDQELAVPKDISAIEARVYLGDFKRKQAFDATGALVHYGEAEAYLLELIDGAVTTAVDNILLTNVAETPRVNKMLSRLKPSKEKNENNVRLSLDPVTAPKPAARGKKAASSTSTLAAVEDGLPMKRMKTRVQTKKARALMMRALETNDTSLLSEAEEILKQCLNELEQLKEVSTKSNNIDKAIVLYHLGRLFMLRSELEGPKTDTKWNQSECAVGVSPFVNKGRRGQKKGVKASVSWTEEAQSMLERAFVYCTSVGSIPKLTRDICQSLALLIGNIEPCRTAFLLNYSLGITLRHEMLSLIASKLMNLRRKKLELFGDVEPDYLEESDPEENDETASHHSGDTVDLEDQDMLASDDEIASLTNNLEGLDLTGSSKRRINFNDDESQDEEEDDEEQEEHMTSANNVKVKAFKSSKKKTTSSKEENALKESLGHVRKLYKLFSFDSNYNVSEFQSQYIDNLPSNWTVCSLAMTADKRDLLITRVQARKLPIVVRRIFTDSATTTAAVTNDTVKKSTSSVKPAAAKKTALTRTKSEISKQALRVAKEDSDSDSEQPRKPLVRAGLKRSTTTAALKPKKPATKVSAPKPSEVIPEDEKSNNNNVVESNINERLIDVIKRRYEKILEDNKNTTTAGSHTNKDTPEDRNKWWTERFKLEEQLKALIDNKMQTELLGFWKSLLVGTPFDDTLRARFNKLAYDLKEKFGKQFDFAEKTRLDLYEAFVNSFEFLSELEIKSWVVYLTHGEATVEDEDAIEALVEHVKSEYALQIGDAKPAAPKKKTTKDSKEQETQKVAIRRNPVIFILDKSLQALPWESMACLRTTPITRMPSLSFIRARLELAKVLQNNAIKHGIDTSKTFYILNPSKDLVTTQEKFEPLFKKYRWRGIAGKTPSRYDFEEALSSHDLVIYCGHNAGEQYISRTHVANVSHLPSTGPTQQNLGIVRSKETLNADGAGLMNALVAQMGKKNTSSQPKPEPVPEYSELTYLNNNAVTMLMGCSSGKLVDNGDFDPDGPILSYLLAGSPAVTGCLWIVTATDTDRFTECILTKWFDQYADRSLSEMILIAREECKLKYLNGAAFICYGLPVFLGGHVPDYYANLK